ncbi:Gfo/Idh/MocA family protein [Arvimicrobium flavum]|uniref:Gfo/Idh/MocA family protein n=1 Tax=Arvimicrobium flavum TaxID=3393320 RepID=UPI00237B3785|nr:Gfo/Idh/MocA family oxidoreductase [Mesorhizobium shangrilense]
MRIGQTHLRIGFIGAGGIAERHVGVLSAMEDVAIVGVADPDFARAADLAGRLGARAYNSHADLIVMEKLDAAYICIPPFAHGDVEAAVIAAALPFFVEKPLSLDIASAERISRTVAARGVVTAVGYHWRYLDTVQEVRDLLVGNPPALVVGYWLDQTPAPRWWWRQGQSGGQIVEQATHAIDLARYLVGEITEVYAQDAHTAERRDFPGLDIATATAVSLRFATGAVGTLSATCLLGWPHRTGLHLFCDGMAIELSDRDIMVDVGRGRPLRQAGSDAVELEDRHFLDAVRGLPNRIRCPYGEALKSHRVTLAIAQSAASRQPVKIDSLVDLADA